MSNEPTNTAIDIMEDVLSSVVKDFLLEKAMKEMIEEVAWLALPVINPIFALIMKFVAKFLYKKSALELAFGIIKKQTDNQRDTYKKEIKDLEIAIKEGKSKDEINKEREEAKKRLKALVNFNAG